MKNLKIVLALVVVLAMAATSFAEVTISVDYLGEVAPGLSSWMVRVGGAIGFSGLNIKEDVYGVPGTNPGLVHQMNEFYYTPIPTVEGGLQQSVFIDEIFGQGVAYDTHYMINSDDVLGTPSNDFSDTETNDKTNPYSLDDGYGGFYDFGMGTFTADPAEGFTIPSPLPPNSDFMQVVYPSGVFAVWLVGNMSDGHETRSICQIIGGPEPSTALMLIIGGLCLLAVRTHK